MRSFATLGRSLRIAFAQPGTRRLALIVSLLSLIVWLCFFDSHSVYRRISWYAEFRAVQNENERLKEEIEALNAKIEAGLSDEVVEQIAREQYGMRRESETVYRIKESE